jgi:hypothetical protein
MKQTGWLLLAAAMLAGCDTSVVSNTGTARPDVSGIYDVALLPAPGPAVLYTVVVEQGGSSGAVVSVTGPASSETVTAAAGASVDLGACGAWMVFGDVAGFTLAAGDSWRINVVSGFPGQPVAQGVVNSTVGPVTAGGLDICAVDPCDGSALSTAVPPLAGLTVAAAADLAAGQWLSVRLDQSGAGISAAIAEEHVLSLNLAGIIVPGDTVTVAFRRRMDADGKDGDFFRAVAVNGAQSLDAEYLWGASVNSGDTAVSLTYTSLSPLGRIDFIVGLSSQAEDFILDSVVVSTVSGGVKITEDFESGGGASCLPTGVNAGLWFLRDPAWSVGGMCLSAQGALAGSYSARWIGGSYRRLTGSVLIGGSSSSLLNEILGVSLGTGIPGIVMESWEPVWTGYFTSLAAAAQSPGVLAGTFRGESLNHVCVEQGEIIAAIHREQETDLASRYWIIRLQGQADNCTPALLTGNTLVFDETLAAAPGDTIPVLQVGQLFAADGVAADAYGNAYALAGLVGGTMVTLDLIDPLLGASAAGVGVVSGDTIQGALTGRLAFDADRVCDLAAGSGFTVSLVDK